VEPEEVAAHPGREVGLVPCLRLDVDQEERRRSLVGELRPCHDVRLPRRPRRHVGEEFLVEERDGSRVEVRRHFGKEELDELDEEGGEKLLEEAIVVHRRPV